MHRGRRLSAEGPVGVDSGVGVDDDVNVRGARGVVPWEDGLELCNAVRVGLLDAAQEGLVDVGGIARVAVALCDDAGVDASGVGVPHLEVDVGDRLAGVDIDDLVVENGVDAVLVLADVAADVLASNIVGYTGEACQCCLWKYLPR